MKRFFIFALLAFVLGWWLGRRAEKIVYPMRPKASGGGERK